jgi:uncharacterized DUF497 family protein
VKIVWDEPKRIVNLEKHGLDFADVDVFEWESATIAPSHSGRMKAIGNLNGRLTVVVYSPRGCEAISLVSLRPANFKERRVHEEE